MKGKIIFFSIAMLALSSSKCIAQAKPNMPQSIISTNASIRTYNDDKTLKAMSSFWQETQRSSTPFTPMFLFT